MDMLLVSADGIRPFNKDDHWLFLLVLFCFVFKFFKRQTLLVSHSPADRKLPALRVVTAASGSWMKVHLAAISAQPPPRNLPRKGNIKALVTFMFTFYFSFLNLTFHLLQFCFECKTILTRQKHWDECFPQDFFIFVDERPTSTCRDEPNKFQTACKTFQSSASEMLLPKSCFGGLIPFYFLILQLLILVQHAKLVF